MKSMRHKKRQMTVLEKTNFFKFHMQNHMEMNQSNTICICKFVTKGITLM